MTPTKIEDYRESEHTSPTTDVIPSVPPPAPRHSVHDYDMLDFGFDTPIRSVNIRCGPPVPILQNDCSIANIVPIDPIATADTDYSTANGKDLVIL